MKSIAMMSSDRKQEVKISKINCNEAAKSEDSTPYPWISNKQGVHHAMQSSHLRCNGEHRCEGSFVALKYKIG